MRSRQLSVLRWAGRVAIGLSVLVGAAPDGATIFDPDPATIPPINTLIESSTAGQILVRFYDAPVPAQGKQAVTKCAVCVQRFNQSLQSATSDNSNSLDLLRAKYQAVILAPAFRGEPSAVASPEPVAALQAAEAARVASIQSRFPKRTSRAPAGAAMPEGLYHWYVVQMPASTDVEAACRAWRTDSHVAACSPNYTMRATAVTLPNDTYVNPSGDGTTWSTGAMGQGALYADLWGLQRVQGVDAWPTTDGTGVLVGVVDTGIDYQHEDLYRDTNGNGQRNIGEPTNVWINPCEDLNGNGFVDAVEVNGVDNACAGQAANGYIDDFYGFDFANSVDANDDGDYLDAGDTRDADPLDDNGHGTHVSGTIGAVRNNSRGIAGIAPGVKILGVKALNAAGSASSLKLGRALIYAAQEGADVINNSWGCSSPCPSNPLAEAAVQQAYALGATVVFAAGNSTDDTASYSPQNMTTSKPVVVASSDPADGASFFSNFGAHVDVTAPGSGFQTPPPATASYRAILSLRANGTGPDEIAVGTRYLRQAGTSMACPHAVGVTALLLASHPGEPFTDTNANGRRDAGEPFSDWGIDGKASTGDAGEGNGVYTPFSNEEARAALRLSSDEVQLAGRDAQSGFGRVNALHAVQRQPGQQITVVPHPQLMTVQSGELETLVEVTLESTWLPINGVSATLVSDNPSVVRILSTGTHPATQSYGNFSAAGMQTTRTFAIQVLSWDTIATQLPLRVTVQGTGFAQVSLALPLKFLVMLPGWPQTTVCTAGGPTSVLAADVNQDGSGDQEIAIGDFCGQVYLWHADGTPLPGWPYTAPPRADGGNVVMGIPAAADLDPSHAGLELVVGGADGYVHFLYHDDRNGDGQPDLMRAPVQVATWNSTVAPAVSLGDLNGDGTIETVVVTQPQFDDGATVTLGAVRVYRQDGSLWWSKNLANDEDPGVRSAALGDLNGDNTLELVMAVKAAGGGGKVYAWTPDGQTLTGWPRTASGVLNGNIFASLGNIDNQAGAEVLLGVGAFVHAWRFTGTEVTGWPVNLTTAAQPSPLTSSAVAVGNLDIDAALEVVIATSGQSGAAQVHALNADGTVLTGWPVTISSNVLLGSMPAIGDISRGGPANLPEIILGAGITRGELFAWHADGTPVNGWPTTLGDWVVGTATLTDLDRNGGINLVLPHGIRGAGSVFVFDFSQPLNAASPPPWSTLNHNRQRTANAQFTPQTAPPKFAPVIQPVADLNIMEGGSISVLVRATDADANLRTLGVAGLPPGATFITLGDINADNQLTALGDLPLITAFVLGTQAPTAAQRERADMDGNGQIEIADAIAVVGSVLGNQQRGLLKWTTTTVQGGIYDLTFAASDADAFVATETVRVSVGDAVLPVLTIRRCNPVMGATPGQRCQEIALDAPSTVGQLSVFELSGTEASGDPLRFSSGLQAWDPANTKLAPLGDVTGNSVPDTGLWVGAGSGLSALDASWILQAVAGIRTLTPSQIWRTDWTNNGSYSALDAVRVLQYVVGLQSTTNTMILTWLPGEGSRGVTLPVIMRLTDGYNTTQQFVNLPVNP